MKKIILFLLLILALPIVIANSENMVYLEDFYDEPIQAVGLRAKEAVMIDFEGVKSTFIINEISQGEFVRVKAFIDYKNNSKGISWPLKAGQSFLVDLNKDEVDDLLMKVTEIGLNEDGEEVVILLFEYIGNPKISIEGESSDTAKYVASKNKQDVPFAAVIGLVLFVLVSLLVVRYINQKPKK